MTKYLYIFKILRHYLYLSIILQYQWSFVIEKTGKTVLKNQQCWGVTLLRCNVLGHIQGRCTGKLTWADQLAVGSRRWLSAVADFSHSAFSRVKSPKFSKSEAISYTERTYRYSLGHDDPFIGCEGQRDSKWLSVSRSGELGPISFLYRAGLSKVLNLCSLPLVIRVLCCSHVFLVYSLSAYINK